MRSDEGLVDVRRSRFATRQPEAAYAYINQQYVGTKPLIRGSAANFDFKATAVFAGPLRADFMKHTMSGESLDTEPFEDLFALHLLRGELRVTSGREERRMLPGDVTLYPFGISIESAYTDIDLAMFRIPLEPALQLAAASAGIARNDFRIESMAPVSSVLGRYWAGIAATATRQLLLDDSAMTNPLIVADTITSLARALLRVFPNTAMTADQIAGPGWVAPAALRRAVAFIEARAAQPLTLKEIAESSGIGARALQHAFARHYGTSPTGYLRQIRLDHVHRELKGADPAQGATVAAIAARWGFAKPSHFTAVYSKTYGQLPSHTLRT